MDRQEVARMKKEYAAEQRLLDRKRTAAQEATADGQLRGPVIELYGRRGDSREASISVAFFAEEVQLDVFDKETGKTFQFSTDEDGGIGLLRSLAGQIRGGRLDSEWQIEADEGYIDLTVDPTNLDVDTLLIALDRHGVLQDELKTLKHTAQNKLKKAKGPEKRDPIKDQIEEIDSDTRKLRGWMKDLEQEISNRGGIDGRNGLAEVCAQCGLPELRSIRMHELFDKGLPDDHHNPVPWSKFNLGRPIGDEFMAFRPDPPRAHSPAEKEIIAALEAAALADYGEQEEAHDDTK